MGREYPVSPVAAVGVVVTRPDRRVLLVRRGNPPSQGQWSLPGGTIELGESISKCARREVMEECGVECEPLELYHAVDIVHRDDGGKVQYHYVIVDLLARWISGDPVPGDDATAAGWYELDELESLDITPGAEEVVRTLLARLATGDV